MAITTTHIDVSIPRFMRVFGYTEIGRLATGGYLRSAEYETDPETSTIVMDLRNSWVYQDDKDQMLSWLVQRALERPDVYSFHESMYDAWH